MKISVQEACHKAECTDLLSRRHWCCPVDNTLASEHGVVSSKLTTINIFLSNLSGSLLYINLFIVITEVKLECR